MGKLQVRYFRYENYTYPHEKNVTHTERVQIMELGDEVKVLDHGYIRYIGHLGTEETIIEAARQSTQKGFLGWGPKHAETCPWTIQPTISESDICNCRYNTPGDEKLLEYLYSNDHATPFEMCELIVQVKAPIMVFREWQRHRTQSFNEMSARYIQMPNEHYVPEPRVQDKANKQGSYSDFLVPKLNDEFKSELEYQQQYIYRSYEEMIDKGVAREVARINTPVSRYSIMWAKANLRNWLHFLNLRMRPNAQLEIRLYANEVAKIIQTLWPRTYALFEEYTLNSVRLSATEVRALQNILITERSDEWPKSLINKLETK